MSALVSNSLESARTAQDYIRQNSSSTQQFSLKSNAPSVSTLAEEASLMLRSLVSKTETTPKKIAVPRRGVINTQVNRTQRSGRGEAEAQQAEQFESALEKPVASVELNSDARSSDEGANSDTFKNVSSQLSWLSPSRLAQIYERLMQTRLADATELWKLVQQQCQDVGSQYLLLLYAKEAVNKELTHTADASTHALQRYGIAAQLKVLLNHELPKFEVEYKDKIAASVNIADIVTICSEAAPGCAPEQLNGFYQDAVMDYASLTALFDLILNRYGMRRFKWATAFLSKALQADYNADGPALPKDRLLAIMRDVCQLQALEGVYYQAVSLWERLKKTYPWLNYSSSRLMLEILNLQSAKISNGQLIKGFLHALNFHGLESDRDCGAGMPLSQQDLSYPVLLLNGAKQILRLVPFKWYAGGREKRDKLLKDLQDVLDDLVFEEESLQASPVFGNTVLEVS